MTNQQIIRTIGCGELHRASLVRPVHVIDVRMPAEFSEAHAAIARNVPLDALDPRILLLSSAIPADEPIYFICEVGVRSACACQMMMAAGYNNVVNVEGGMQAWVAAGLPVQQQG